MAGKSPLPLEYGRPESDADQAGLGGVRVTWGWGLLAIAAFLLFDAFILWEEAAAYTAFFIIPAFIFLISGLCLFNLQSRKRGRSRG